MANKYTKNLIRAEFIKALSHKQYNKITVTEITRTCNINRNSFYYYYSNLGEVLKEIFEDELSEITSGYYDGKPWHDTLLRFTKFARENRNAVYHVYHSLQREELEQFLYTAADRILTKVIEDDCRGLDVDIFDQRLIVKLHQMALTGMLIEWISAGMKTDINHIIDRLTILLEDSFKVLIERSMDSKNGNKKHASKSCKI